MMTNWSDYERFLKPIHLKGQAMTLTVVRASEEKTHPNKGETVISPVLWFRELPFGMILSPTNRRMLQDLYGDPVSNAFGKPIVVKAIKLSVAGSGKEPIRIQNVRPSAPAIEPSTGEIVEPAIGAEPPAAGDLPDKITDAPDYCKTHLFTMTEKSKTGVLFHRVQVEGKTGYCDGATIKFNGGGQ